MESNAGNSDPYRNSFRFEGQSVSAGHPCITAMLGAVKGAFELSVLWS